MGRVARLLENESTAGISGMGILPQPAVSKPIDIIKKGKFKESLEYKGYKVVYDLDANEYVIEKIGSPEGFFDIAFDSNEEAKEYIDNIL